MGIERARVVEVHARTSATGRVGAGYLISDRLVLTAIDIVGRRGPTDVRPGGTFGWTAASVLWLGETTGTALLAVDDPSALMVPPATMPWGEALGAQPIPVMAMGFPAASARPDGVRDPELFFGHLLPRHAGGQALLAVAARAGSPTGTGMAGAALFAGAEIVGVVVAGPGHDDAGQLRAVSAGALAADDTFVGLVGDAHALALTPVRAPSYGLPILAPP